MQHSPENQLPPGSQIHHFVTTAFQFDGYRIVRNIGIIRGIIVRSRSVIGNFGAQIQQIVGGDISLYSELCENTRSDAYERMIYNALQVGANAIVGVRYDTTEIAAGVTEVLCYGTAIVVEATDERSVL